MWIINPFIAEHVDKADVGVFTEDLLELTADLVKGFSFKGREYYGDFWVSLLDSDYRNIAIIALQKLVLMPTTYLSEKGFSCLVEIKTQKRNRLKSLDGLMRVALENSIRPRFEELMKNVQKQCSH